MATYKRGNDEVDLDQYIRDAEAGFNFWLSHPSLNDKQRQDLRDVYRKMIQGISDGSVTYKLGGGYDNTIGITNKDDKFDAAGLVAGYLGDVLRRQAVYKAPDPEPDTSKIEYKGATTIGELALPALLGEGLNPQYFINLDLPGEDGKRGHANRLAAIQTFLKDIHDNWDTRFRGFSQEQKDRWFKDYDLYGNIDLNNNNLIDENEYLGLSKLMGINNVDQLLYTGKTYGETAKSDTPVTYANETEYLNAKHPRSTSTLKFSRTFTNNQHHGQNFINTLNNVLDSLSKDQLLTLIGTGIQYPKKGRELSHIAEIIQAFGGAPNFDNDEIIQRALEISRINDYLEPFSENSNRFYIPINSERLDSNNIGLVYEISQGGNHKVNLMDRRDIPYFTKKWHDEFVTYTPVHKDGGTIRKLAPGDTVLPKANVVLANNDTWDNDWYQKIFSNFKQDILNSFEKIESDNTLTPDQKLKAKTDLVNSINSMQERHYNLMGNWDRVSSIRPDKEDIKKYQNDILNNYSYVNRAIGDSIDLFKTLNNANLGYDSKGKWAPDNRGEGYTFARTLLGTIKSLKKDDQFWTAMSKYGVSQTLKDGFGDYNFLSLNSTPATNTSPVTTETEQTKTPTGTSTDQPVDPIQQRLLNKQKQDTKPTTPVKEDQLPDLPQEEIKSNKWWDVLPNLAGIGRLPLSLYTNRNVYKAIDPSLKPIIPETYERYSPVKGRFDKLQLGESQKASLLSRAYRPFTTDASLASSIMLDAHRQAMQYENQAFLEDNQEIARTANEALVRQEDNAARRTDNFNKALTSINQTNRERAQLKANYYQSNWKSIDNFLQEQQKNLTSKFEKKKLFSDQFRGQIAASEAQRWYDNVMEMADKEKDAWIRENTKNGITPDITTWGPNGSRYAKYQERQKKAEAMRIAMLRKAAAEIYGLSYTSPYNDLQYKNFESWI